MTFPPPSISADEQLLGELAMQFRGTRNEAERKQIVDKYCEAVNRLIAGKSWKEMPALEDQLPDDRMPESFFKYWQIRLS